MPSLADCENSGPIPFWKTAPWGNIRCSINLEMTTGDPREESMVCVWTPREIASAPPDQAEVRDAVDRIVNGFIFNFETPALTVSRQMLYLSQNLPLDWLPRFLTGVQSVTPGGVHEVFRRNLAPNGLDDMVILIVGDPARFDPGLEDLGPVRFLEEDEAAPRP